MAEAKVDLKGKIVELLGEVKEATTAEIIAALRKKHNISMKSHDINPIMYKDGMFDVARKGITGAPYWQLKASSITPTIACSACFVTISPTWANPAGLIGSILTGLASEGITSVKCNHETELGRLAAKLAAETGLRVDGTPKKPAVDDSVADEVAADEVAADVP